jgi:hypothetical protein
MALRLSQKQIDFIAYDSRIDVVEGPSGTGKTTAAKLKFINRTFESERLQHFIAAESAVVANRNLVDGDTGLLELSKGAMKRGTKNERGQHLIMRDDANREKIIYILGYGDESRWKDILGSTTGCGLIDEANLAKYKFIVQAIRGMSRPTADFYLCFTLNPQDPSHENYQKLLNKARPLRRLLPEIPQGTIEELRKSPMMARMIYWHFLHQDNPELTAEAIQTFRDALLPGSPEYLSLIDGVRTTATGAVYAKYLNDSFYYDESDKSVWFDHLDVGIDIGSGAENAKSVMHLTGFQTKDDNKTHVYVHDDYLCTEIDSDNMINEWCDRIEEWETMYPGRIDGVYLDGAGVGITIIRTVADRLKARGLGHIGVAQAWKFGEKGGIRDRILVMNALINQHRLHFRRGTQTMEMLKKIVRGLKGEPILDNNDLWNDYYDSFCYSWTHMTEKIR